MRHRAPMQPFDRRYRHGQQVAPRIGEGEPDIVENLFEALRAQIKKPATLRATIL